MKNMNIKKDDYQIKVELQLTLGQIKSLRNLLSEEDESMIGYKEIQKYFEAEIKKWNELKIKVLLGDTPRKPTKEDIAACDEISKRPVPGEIIEE
jgi:hypothetical protein